jgi:serine/threonine protein kinase
MGHKPQPDMEPEYDPDALDDNQSASSPSPQPAAPGMLIGQTLGGRYRFDALLGEGTFARVFRVHDLHRRVDLAAKVLRSDVAQEPAFLERFRREAKVLETLQHPNIVRYYDIVELDSQVFILTDYIPGQTLQSVLRQRRQPLSLLESLNYLTPLAAALHFAHREGIVHRDLKPANILLDENENLYVTDFGIARILSDTSTLTVDTTVGTPHYMSPEQILTAEITAATDIYALGVMLYQMYTGRLPFTGDSQGTTGTTAAVRIVYEHLHVDPIPPSQLNPRISKAVEDVILRCLAKDPAQRYSSVSALYDALNDAIGTPSMSLDAASVAQAVAAEGPEAERVPTGVGGLSQAVPQGEPDKPKREESSPASFGDFGEKEAEKHEKEDEKEHDYDEKTREKEDEKGAEKEAEKSEFWGDVAGSDRLSQFTWGGVILWAGIAFLLESAGAFGNVWAWVFAGAGALMLAEVGARMALPDYRARPGGRFIMGLVFLMVGLGLGVGFGSLWPLILIAIGIGLLLNRFVE